MKTVRIDLPDDDAEALARAAAANGFASPAEFVRVVIEGLLVAPVEYDAGALARDVARHREEKRRGEPGLTPDQARAWLHDAALE